MEYKDKGWVWFVTLSFLILVSVFIYDHNKSQSIEFVYPKGGEEVNTGSTQTIKWQTKNIPGSYKIAVSIRRIPPPPLQEEGQEFDPIIFTDLPNTGEVVWNISDMYPNGNYVLGLTAYKATPITNPITAESKEFTISKVQIVGGDRDHYGCIPSAGYSWCEARNECVRPWETYCTSVTPKKVTFECKDNKSIDASFYIGDDKFVDLVLSDGRNISVPRAMSASGARYANADETFVFWNKGDTAFITEGTDSKKTYTDCIIK